MGALRQWQNRHIECPYCKAHHANKYGKKGRKKQAYLCKECGMIFTEDINYVIPKDFMENRK